MAVQVLDAAGVPQALACRRELINFKKVCLKLFQQMMVVEKDIRQLSTFFYCDLMISDTSSGAPNAFGMDSEFEMQKQRYRELGQAMNQCKGSVAAIHDARYFTKVRTGIQ